MPTREPAGQVSAANCARGQSAVAPAMLAPRPTGRVTAALDCPDSPAPCEIVAVNGTWAVLPVAPGAPIEAATCGAKRSWSQAVGVKVELAEAVDDAYESASSTVLAGLQEVGLVMNGWPPTSPFSVSDTSLIVVGSPDVLFGMLRTAESMPKSVAVRRLIAEVRKILPASPPSGATTIPSSAGSFPLGTRL